MPCRGGCCQQLKHGRHYAEWFPHAQLHQRTNNNTPPANAQLCGGIPMSVQGSHDAYPENLLNNSYTVTLPFSVWKRTTGDDSGLLHENRRLSDLTPFSQRRAASSGQTGQTGCPCTTHTRPSDSLETLLHRARCHSITATKHPREWDRVRQAAMQPPEMSVNRQRVSAHAVKARHRRMNA